MTSRLLLPQESFKKKKSVLEATGDLTEEVANTGGGSDELDFMPLLAAVHELRNAGGSLLCSPVSPRKPVFRRKGNPSQCGVSTGNVDAFAFLMTL